MNSNGINALLKNARKNAEKIHAQKSYCVHALVDNLVSPGMILEIKQPKDINPVPIWSLGSGLVNVPSKLTSDVSESFFVLVRRFGILRSLQVRGSGGDGTKRSSDQLWVEALSLSPTGTVPSLGNRVVTCHASQFALGDRLLGVVSRRVGENYFVDVGAPTAALIHYLAFEGASKKNRPDIRLKDVIYAEVIQADADLEIELSCVTKTGSSSGMGILGRYEPGSVGNACGMNGGIMLYCSLELTRRLSNEAAFPLLRNLSKRFPFEICIGCNGRMWLTARSPRETMLLANTICLADYATPEACLKLADELF